MEAATSVGATPDAPIRGYKPTSPGRRHRKVVDKRGLWPGRPVKKLTCRIQMRGGRSRSTGKITVWGRSASKHKRIYRKVDFHRKRDDAAIVKRFEYDPNRSAFIALIEYDSDKALSYILAPQGLKVGDTVQANDDAPFAPGNAMPLEFIPDGTLVHNIEMIRGMGGKMARSAGTGAKVQSKDGNLVILKMQSGEVRKVKSNCLASIGQVRAPHKTAPGHGVSSASKSDGLCWDRRPLVVRHAPSCVPISLHPPSRPLPLIAFPPAAFSRRAPLEPLPSFCLGQPSPPTDSTPPPTAPANRPSAFRWRFARQVSNPNHRLRVLGKAGANRWIGRCAKP